MEKLDILFQDEHKYTLDEIKVGMRVRTSQLENIYDINIILVNLKDVFDAIGIHSWEGEIADISKEDNIGKYDDTDDVVVVYNSSIRRDFNIGY